MGGSAVRHGGRSGPTDGAAIRKIPLAHPALFAGKGCAGEVAELYSRWAAVCGRTFPTFAPGKGKGGISQRRRQPESPSASAGTGAGREMGKSCFPFALIAVTPKAGRSFPQAARPSAERPAFTGGWELESISGILQDPSCRNVKKDCLLLQDRKTGLWPGTLWQD